jgi:PAS domain S-box-containing protein
MPATRILIVEDEMLIARELESRLTGLGYEVVDIASSGREAINLVEQGQPHLVLMDIVLKGDMDGIEAATQIRRRWSLPVIYLTAYTDDNTLKRARVTEPFGYIVKPFSERELRANIEMALYKHQVESRMQKVEMWFASTIEQTAAAVIATDQDGVIKLVNPAAESLIELTEQEAVGKKLDDILRLIHTRTSAPVPWEQELGQSFVVCLGEDTLLVGRKGMRKPVDITISHLRNQAGESEGLVVVFREVGRVKRGALACLNADIAIALGRASSLREILQACAESIARNLDAAFARIWTLNESKAMLELQASAGMYTHLDGSDSRVPVGEFKIGLIAQEKAPHLTNES